MLWCRFLRWAKLAIAAAAMSCASLTAQTQPAASNSANSAAATQPSTPAPPQVMYGGTVGSKNTQVVPISGETKIHGSTVPAAMMPREESLGDAARRLKKKKYRKYQKNQKRKTARRAQPPYLR